MCKYLRCNFYAIENRDEKQGVIIKEEPLSTGHYTHDEKYIREEECKNDDYKNINFNVIKDDYYWAKKIVDKIERYCRCIKISVGSEKCVELLTIYIRGFLACR